MRGADLQPDWRKEVSMTVCPIAIAVGCAKCPAFKVCPVKSLLGDQPKASAATPDKKPAAKAKRPK
jgi:hypothetical protein